MPSSIQGHLLTIHSRYQGRRDEFRVRKRVTCHVFKRSELPKPSDPIAAGLQIHAISCALVVLVFFGGKPPMAAVLYRSKPSYTP